MTEARQVLVKNWDQRKISRATVLVGGCGATGSQTAVMLARIGVGTIVVVDDDVLEKHNVYNQVYRKIQIGKTKVHALQEIIEEISGCEIIPIKAKLQDAQIPGLEPDAMLGCFDNAAARFLMNFLAINEDTLYIDAGIAGYMGSIRTIIPKVTPCLQCWLSMIPNNGTKAGCSKDPIPSTYFTASYASSLQVMQLVNLLFGKNVDPLITFDLERGNTTAIKLIRNKECGLCNM
ncbi:MAG: ThiF family adenylyltransferase [Candidatus Thermoplasmatota archaeon]